MLEGTTVTGENMLKMAVLEIHPRMFREILQLPEGAEVVDMRIAIDRRGILELKIVGAGFDTKEGEVIRRVTGTVTKNAGGWPFIDWGLPSNAGNERTAD